MLRTLELCAGYGGFSLALHDIARTVCFVERDAYAAAVLVARMRDGGLPPGAIWDDLATFDGRPWRGRVDLITAGFPCQPFSAAGQRRGIVDDRWLWPDIERIISDVEPGYVFLENVPGVVAHGLPEICHSLADLGFDAEWALYSAADVGAPHRRNRFWLVGHRMVDAESGSTARVTRGLRAETEEQHDSEAVHEVRHPAETGIGHASQGVAHHHDQGRSPLGREPEYHRQPRGDVDGQGGTDMADPASLNEREPNNRTTKDAPSHGVTHGRTLAGSASHHPPTTTPDGPNGPPKVDLNPAFVEALMGLPSGWLTASISAETDSSPNAPAPHGNCSPNAADG